MSSYCLKCKKNLENIKSRVSNSSNGRIMLLSKCAICGNKKSRFIKKEEWSGILGLKTQLNKILWLGDILLCMYKMNEIVTKLLLAGAKSMSEMHLKQPRFT